MLLGGIERAVAMKWVNACIKRYAFRLITHEYGIR